jgi:hypothetical protein
MKSALSSPPPAQFFIGRITARAAEPWVAGIQRLATIMERS